MQIRQLHSFLLRRSAMNRAFKFEVREGYRFFFLSFFFFFTFVLLFFLFVSPSIVLFSRSSFFKKYQETIEVLKKRQCVRTRIPRKIPRMFLFHSLPFVFHSFLYSFTKISRKFICNRAAGLDSIKSFI